MKPRVIDFHYIPGTKASMAANKSVIKWGSVLFGARRLEASWLNL